MLTAVSIWPLRRVMSRCRAAAPCMGSGFLCMFASVLSFALMVASSFCFLQP